MTSVVIGLNTNNKTQPILHCRVSFPCNHLHIRFNPAFVLTAIASGLVGLWWIETPLELILKPWALQAFSVNIIDKVNTKYLSVFSQGPSWSSILSLFRPFVRIIPLTGWLIHCQIGFFLFLDIHDFHIVKLSYDTVFHSTWLVGVKTNHSKFPKHLKILTKHLYWTHESSTIMTVESLKVCEPIIFAC